MEGYRVEWTPGAVSDLDKITIHIAGDSPAGARRVQSGILNRVASLARFPHLGSIYSTRGRRVARQITFRKYRIFYRVVEKERRVEILSVWHGARREPLGLD